MPLCSQTTARGKPCANQAALGSDLCGYHLRRRRGRPTKLTDEIADQLVTLLGSGNYDETAALAAGISARTLRGWLQRGRESAHPDDEPYRRLRTRTDEARAKGEAAHVARVSRAAAEGDWKASAWFLERAYPERWARPAVRPAAAEPPPEVLLGPTPDDPFAEVDELAAKRRDRAGV